MSAAGTPSDRAARAWRALVALGIAALGGTVFFWLSAPLPFMLGAMAFCAVAAMARVPVAPPMPLRPPMAALIGAMLGSSFTTDVVTGIQQWIVPMIGLVLFMLASALVSVTYLRRVAGFDAKTAFFAGMPGGLADMALIGEAAGGDIRRIATTHATRIMVIVFTVPFLVGLLSGNSGQAVIPAAVSVADVKPIDFAWLFATSVAGVLLGHVARLPAKLILGPMLVSAVVHLLGWTDFKLPYELIMVAQVVLGCIVGCRFIGLGPRDFASMAVAGIGSSLILLALTAAFAVVFSMLSPLSAATLALAYSPGGFIEMGLVALALGIDTAIVATHHAVRILLVGLLAPLTYSILDRRRPGQFG